MKILEAFIMRKVISILVIISIVFSSVAFAFATGKGSTITITDYSWNEISNNDLPISITNTSDVIYYHYSCDDPGYIRFEGNFSDVVIDVYDSNGNHYNGLSYLSHATNLDFPYLHDDSYIVISTGEDTSISSPISMIFINAEYKLNSLTITNLAGDKLDAIPKDNFMAKVSAEHIVDNGNAQILLAAYTAQGQYKSLMLTDFSEMGRGTFSFSLMMDNSNGDIATVKAFAVSSLADLTPSSNVVEYMDE